MYITTKNFRELYFELTKIEGDKRRVVVEAVKATPPLRLIDFIITATQHIYALEKQLDAAGDPDRLSLDPEL
jgi:hypothetical protein